MLSLRYSRCLLLLLALLGVAYSYPTFQQRIPNGESVPDPCSPNHLWKGVGHLVRGGGSTRNDFGEDFDKNGQKWTPALCRMDSDGDGKTNGDELGDPDCVWTPGQEPTRKVLLSHPGVCEPIDSPKCRNQASFVVCENLEFECAALDEPGMENLTVRFPETAVPAVETTYMCMGFEFPKGDYHMVANVPLIDNINVMHHVVVYGCTGEAKDKLNEPYNCFMSGKEGCDDIIGIWSVGMLGQCIHPNTGFRVGNHQAAYTWGVMEMHWNNPAQISDWTDSSGMLLYLTKNKRPNDAGMMLIGQQFLEIPPGEERHTETGTVPGTCTQKMMTGPVNVVGAFNHMHYLGNAAKTSLISGNGRVTQIAKDEEYSYDRPVFHNHADPIRMNPGDKLQLDCHFKSTSRTKTTFFGESTNAEMCYAFVMYYPKENLKQTSLGSWMDASTCEFEGNIMKGCNFTELSDFTNPETAGRYTDVQENCAVGVCRKECKELVKRINKHPCYHGAPRRLLVQYAINDNMDLQTKYYSMLFWAHMDSCNEEILRDRIDELIAEGTSDAAIAAHSMPLMTSAMLLWIPIMVWLMI